VRRPNLDVCLGRVLESMLQGFGRRVRETQLLHPSTQIGWAKGLWCMVQDLRYRVEGVEVMV